MYQIRKQGSVTVLTPEIAINDGTVDRLNNVITSHITERPAFLVIDLHAVPLFDSRGLEWFLNLQDQTTRLGGEMKLASANSLCCDILSVTGVDQRVSIYPDTITAVGSFSR